MEESRKHNRAGGDVELVVVQLKDCDPSIVTSRAPYCHVGQAASLGQRSFTITYSESACEPINLSEFIII